MGERTTIRLEVPGVLRSRPVVLETVAAACRLIVAAGARDAHDFRNHVVSAVSEAFNNIAVHGYRGIAPDVVRLEIDVGEDAMTIDMWDYGHAYTPDAEAPPDALPESGMGVFIMRSFMDEVDYTPGRPNKLRLKKRVEG